MFNQDGTKHITNLINEAIEKKTRTVTVTGNWEIESAVILPSDITLILDGCHLRLKDGIFDNMFRNEHCGDTVNRIPGEGNKNIRILGKNGAILDGGTYNGLHEKIAGKEGRPHMFVNNTLLFVNVDGFEVSNLHCRNNRYWTLNFIYCSDGVIRDIDFLSNHTAIDENGNEYYTLLRDKPLDLVVKNADGIDLRCGCHDIVIENITGFTGDDTVALTGIMYKDLRPLPYYTEGKPIDICNVKIKNVRSASHCTNVRMLSQGGIPVHDIEVDGVYDMSGECDYLDHGRYGVRIGDGKSLYGTRQSTEDEVYNITVKNVRSRARDGALHLGGGMRDITLENIKGFDGTIDVEDCR